MQKQLKCQASGKLSCLILCIALLSPCLVRGKENASIEAPRIEHAQKVPKAIRRTVFEAHRSKTAAMHVRPKRGSATGVKKSMTASSVTKPGAQAASTSGGQLHGTKADTAWFAETWLISNRPLTRFDKRLEYRFEEDAPPGAARVNFLMDRNNDGMIDPMEYALGWIGMTDVGDVGLRERDMGMERIWLQDRLRFRPLVSPVKLAKSESRSSLPKPAKRRLQKRL